ncbi:MAG: Stage V sporulation protein D [bacterium ADurb.Bin400]|nr:MAG: Stage V sporulation protein D [bacterium ADurb.Bin400]
MDIFGNFSELRGDREKRRITQKEGRDFSYSDAVIESVSVMEDKEQLSNPFGVKFAIAAVFLLMVFRLFFLQVIHADANQKLAEGNRIRPRVIEASRGLITDKNGVWLARNKPDFALALYPSDLPKRKDDREKVMRQVSEVSGVPYEEIERLVQAKGNHFLEAVVIKDHISHDEALLFEEKTMDIPGVHVALYSSREYAVLPGIAHILGYTGSVSKEDIEKNEEYFLTDRVGKVGLEKEYESDLRGIHGVEQIEVDSRGNVVRVLVKEGNRTPVPGHDVVLYMDRDLQAKAAEALHNGFIQAAEVTGREISAGTVLVMDVKTGGIIAMVSLPDYDNNLFAGKITNEDYQRLINDSNQPLFNRAIKGTYPPGSIVKIVMAAAGLSERVVDVKTAFDTPLAIEVGEYRFPDWKDHGVTNVERAIAESNNIFFYAIGGGFDKIRGIGIEKIKEYWQMFGLGRPTGVDLPGEGQGLLPDPEWKRTVKNEPWYLGDTYHVSIGQGDLLVTPMQMLKMTAVIASGGKLIEPQLVKEVINHNGDIIQEFKRNVEQDGFLDSEVVKTIARGMRMTVTDGSARSLASLPVSVAGKTGTAQFFNNEKTHAWFEAYAPFEDPQIAIVVLIEGGGGGNEVAVPVAREIIDYYFSR